MKNLKKLTIILMLVTLIGLPVNVWALEKTETVYANLTYTGKEKEKTVVSKLKYQGEETISDETKLKKILNINGKEEYQIEGDKIIWKTNKKDIYYQGNSEEVLPISIKIKYYLNGEKISAKKLIGKKGEIKITMEYKNNNESTYQGRTIYTPFVLTVGTMMDSTKNKDIQISNGKVVETGTKSLLIGLASPGLSESMNISELNQLNKTTIKYHTEKFSQDNIYVVATPKLFDQGDLEVFDQLNSSLSKIDDLQAGTDELEKGSKELKNGVAQIQGELGNKINELNQTNYESIGTLSEQQITNELNQKVNVLVKNAVYQVVKQKLTITKQAVINNSCQTITDPTQFEACKQQVENTLTIDQWLPHYQQPTYQEIQRGVDQVLNYSAISLSDENKSLATLISFQVSGILFETGYTRSVGEGLAINQLDGYYTPIFNQVASTYGKIAHTVGVNLSSQMVAKTTGSLTTLYQAIEKLNQGSGKIAEGISTINHTGINTLSNLADTYENYTDLIKQLKRLSKAYKGFGSTNSKNTKFIYKIKSVK